MQNSIALFLTHWFHFSLVFIKIHRHSALSQEALTQSLSESDFGNQGQEFLKTKRHPKERLLFV